MVALYASNGNSYALYLQNFEFIDDNIMKPIKPLKTVLVPSGEGYIGGEYYFVYSEEKIIQQDLFMNQFLKKKMICF